MRLTRKRKYRKRYCGGTPKRLKNLFGIPPPDARRRRSVVPTNESPSNVGSLISVPNPSQLTPPMSPRDYPSEFKYISKELGNVEKERDNLLIKLTKFSNEINELKKMLATAKKNEEGEDFLIKIIALLFKLNTICIFDVFKLNKEYTKLNDLIARAFTRETPFNTLKELIIEINNVQKKNTDTIKIKLNENVSGIKELLDKLGESNFKQIEKIFKEMNFDYEVLLTPELMKTPTPSPPGVNYEEAKNQWLTEARQSRNRFKPGPPVRNLGDNRNYPTIASTRSGRLSPIARPPKKTGKLRTSGDLFNLAKPPRSKASGSKKKKSN
tara:strand:+ start:205 stop:1182 length:978 start_codon:yes stop_codon:yes gene_type:complete